MSAPEPLCDLKMIKADYRLVGHKDREPDHCFRIRVIPNKQEMQFDVPEKNGELLRPHQPANLARPLSPTPRFPTVRSVVRRDQQANSERLRGLTEAEPSHIVLAAARDGGNDAL